MSDNRTALRQLAGQLIMIRLTGTELDAGTAAFIRDNRIRAVCLFRNNMTDGEQLAKFTADLRAVMGPQALIALDQEGGAVVRAKWVPAPPAAMALGAADDPELARRVGGAVARAVRALGFNWNFAPVLDLNNNLNNPVIAERSFGADPQRATEIALAWMDGSLQQGVACCVKHVPGHGDTTVDSHRDLPTVGKSRDALEALEFSPFRQAASTAPAMMTAHIVYPALDPDRPATLSRKILTDLIRMHWQYQGVVITDGMDMKAIADRYGAGSAAVMALDAGADMVMAIGDPASQNETLDAIADAIEAGTLQKGSLLASVARLDALAAQYPSAAPTYDSEVADRALMATAWQRGLTPYREPQRPAQGAKLRLVVREDSTGDGVSEAGVSAAHLTAWLGQDFDVETVTFKDQFSLDWGTLPQDGRFTILASTTRSRYGEPARSTWKPDLHVVLWNPFQALDIDAPALLTYGFVQPALDAVSMWLKGELDATGRNPCL